MNPNNHPLGAIFEAVNALLDSPLTPVNYTLREAGMLCKKAESISRAASEYLRTADNIAQFNSESLACKRHNEAR